MEETSHSEVEIHDSEVSVTYARGSGPGGQHRNKTESCVVMTHNATGIQARVDGRHQQKNEREAKKVVTERVNHFYKTGKVSEIEEIRKQQIGTGQRGDKRRTYRIKEGVVVDHVNGKTAKWKDVSRGKLGGLHI